MAVHLDISELVVHPLRSGIQRVEREAIRHWPGPSPLIPCIVDAQGTVRQLSQEALAILCTTDEGATEFRSAEREMLAKLVTQSEPLADIAIRRLLNLELFFDPVRTETHIRLATAGSSVFWYLYDFLPFLRPELFPQGTTRHCMHFIRALRGVGNRLAFLSEATRTDYHSRIAHGRSLVPSQPVINPGADGLGLERQVFSAERRNFVSIGTVELRKNTGALLRAFERLWERGVSAPLVVAGRIDSNYGEAQAFFARHRDNVQLTFLNQPSDETLCEVLRRARAVVMPSEAEGFGLPPYEALHAGIPSIASDALPSAALLSQGVILLPKMDCDTIAASVTDLLDDERAAQLWRDASSVRLPNWADFGRMLGDWAQAD